MAKAEPERVTYSQPTKSFSFLDLPPEVRNNIYEYCLIASKEVSVRYRYKPCVQGGSNLNIQLLATCRQIHGEGSAIFYGYNSFELFLWHSGVCFLTEIGQSIRYLRHVGLADCDSQKSFEIIMHQMANATDLEKLTIGADYWYFFFTADKLAAALGPFIQTLHSFRNGTDKKSVLEVLDFDAGNDSREGRRWNRMTAKARLLLERGISTSTYPPPGNKDTDEPSNDD